ncbi:MAG: hypothetical protein ABIS36_18320 [Chryseolinea sp.]
MKKVLLIVLLGLSSTGFSQKIKLIEGDLSALKGLTGINNEFNYDNMAVGKFPKEADYVEKKKSDYNNKEAGKGDKWEEAWKNDRTEKYEPEFRDQFSKASSFSIVSDSPVTMIFKTTETEPGYNVVVKSAPAFINGEAWFVDSKNPSKVLAKVSVTKALGRAIFGNEFDTGARLQESYAKAGRELGLFVRSKLK